MKKYFALILFALLYACQPKTVEKDGGLIVDIRISNNTATEEEINDVIETLKDRLNYMGCEDPIVSLQADKRSIQIQLPLVKDSTLYRDYVLGKGIFSIRRGITAYYLEQNIKNLNQAILQSPEINARIPFDTHYRHQSDSLNPLSRILSPAASSGTSLMGYALPKDTVMVGSILQNEKFKRFLPEDIGYKWSKEFIENHCCLYIVKKADKNDVVTADMLVDVKKHKDDYGNYTVQLSLEPQYYKILAHVTDLGQPIVIDIDNKVFSAPRGSTTIPNGEAIISSLSLDEANYLVTLFKYGALKLDVKVEKMMVIDLSKPAEQSVQSNESVRDSAILYVDPKQLQHNK